MPPKNTDGKSVLCFTVDGGETWNEIKPLHDISLTEAMDIEDALRNIWQEQDGFLFILRLKIPNNRRRHHGLKPMRTAWKKTFRHT